MRNTRVTAIAALHDARERRRQGLHLAEGARVCSEALTTAEVVELLHDGQHADVARIAGPQVRVTEVSEPVMRRLSDASTPPGIVAVVRTPDVTRPIPATGALLVLDGVADPGNVGTLLRTAAAFGATVVSIDGADPFGPKAVRASAGGCYRTPVHRLTGADVSVDALRGAGRVVLGLAADGERTIAEVAADIPTAGAVLVVGSEPTGLRPRVSAAIDVLVRIPMAPGVESLNVAAAGAIAMHAVMPV